MPSGCVRLFAAFEHALYGLGILEIEQGKDRDYFLTESEKVVRISEKDPTRVLFSVSSSDR